MNCPLKLRSRVRYLESIGLLIQRQSVSYRAMHYGEARFMGFTLRVVHNFTKAGVSVLCAQTDPRVPF